ncbi:RxLR effector protein [Phytophthora megakarya]|uniref:RxLR effector protein n=1 Tax=Phytophthora megakarya TaxID=4795 RepID=A0A225X0N7_9STRA|nr:RxLR effector protein [Phytophthora megakarya]
MRGRGIFLVGVVALLVNNVFSTETTRQTLTSANLIVAGSSTSRLLRVEKSANVDSYSFKDTVRGDDGEERVGEVKALEKLKSLKPVKSFTRSMSRASKSIADKLSPMLPKSRLEAWSKSGKSVSFVKKELGLENLSGVAFKEAKNFQYYDDFVISQLPIWTKKQLTPDEVIAQLGLQGLSGTALKTNPNFKYYEEFLKTQILVWEKDMLAVDDVLLRLNLNTLTGATRTEAVNFKYYNEFVINQMKSWMANNVPVDDVMVKLNLNGLSGDDFLNHPNYPYYKSFVVSKLKSWATYDVSPNDVRINLGLGHLNGQMLESHPNFKFLQRYENKLIKYQEDGWLKHGVTTYEYWNAYQVYRVKPSRRKSTNTYKAYKNYVEKMDNYIIGLKEDGFDIPPNLISKDASPEELWEKTLIWTSNKRPDWYVKYSLGLDGLGENAMKEAPNLKLYEYYLDGMKRIQ